MALIVERLWCVKAGLHRPMPSGSLGMAPNLDSCFALLLLCVVLQTCVDMHLEPNNIKLQTTSFLQKPAAAYEQLLRPCPEAKLLCGRTREGEAA